MEDDPVINVEVLGSEIEARLLGAILDERGIEHVLLTYHDTAYDGIFQAQKGWGVIRAPRSSAPEIRAILADIRSGEGIEDFSGEDDSPD
ncbi:MAG: hypothetical protein ABIJ95_03780 [Pseudomonadota bacterium]